MKAQTRLFDCECTCEKWIKKIIIFTLGAMFSGCTHTLYLPPVVLSTNSDIGKERKVYVAMPFVDKRDIRNSCGEVGVHDVVCDIDPTQWLANLLVLELKDSGFNVLTQTNEYNGNIPKIEGTLFKVYAEHIPGLVSVNFEMDIHILLSVKTNEGFKAERTFYSKGIDISYLGGSPPYFGQANLKAAQQVIVEMRNAIAELMDNNF